MKTQTKTILKPQTKTICLDRRGVDAASEMIGFWLETAGLERRDIARIRLTMEEMLSAIARHGEGVLAELRFSRRFGEWRLRVRYDGDRFDPTAGDKSELDEWTEELLSRTGFVPVWHWRLKKNELLFRIPTRKRRPEILMLACIAAALVIGILGQSLPETVRTIASDYVLSFLSDGFLNLLNTFIGPMIFLSIVTGICGIGSSSALGRIGKLMISRFIGTTFVICGILTVIVRFCFPLSSGSSGGSSQFRAILEMIFTIIPSNPVKPFLDGNTFQIVFLAAVTGTVLLLTGSETEGVRKFVSQMQTVVIRCISAVCMLLPVYIFSSLVMLFWKNGADVLLQFWKPIVLNAVLCVLTTAVYLLVTCRKLNVKPGVLVPKLVPDFLIALSSSSSSAAFSKTLEINETKLGIDPAFSRTAVPVGNILFSAAFCLIYVMSGAFLAEYYGVQADIAWWIILWLVSSLLCMATPPVAGGMISCLSILLLQLEIPQEGLILGVTLTMLMDFFCTSFRVACLHLELILQADRLNLLDREMLRRKC